MNKLTLLYGKILPIELEKDVVLAPKYLGKALGYKSDVVCSPDREAYRMINKYSAGINFICKRMGDNPITILLFHIAYLFKHARHISVLFCFHLRIVTILKIWLYSLLNNKGKIYVKLDTDKGWEFMTDRYSNPLRRWMRKRMFSVFISKVDVISCETSVAYKNLCADLIFGQALEKKVVLMPNGFDEEKLQSLQMHEKSFEEKENLIITVGRLGSHQKNTEMFLQALEKIDLKDWKVVLIGPVEKSLKPVINTFFELYPEKRTSVQFIGAVYDKKILWSFYNRARVFVLTSRWESYGLVLNEAKRFRNYIVSTNVGAAIDLIEDQYGSIVENDNVVELALRLNEIVELKRNIDVYHDFDPKLLSYEHYIKFVADKLKF